MSDASFCCRSCGARDLVPVLSLGKTPLANALLTDEELNQAEPAFPLELVFCPACSLAQITETVAPEVLFREYLYFSSFSDTMVDAARRLTVRLVAERRLDAGSLVVEVASNDGYLLQHYLRAGVPVLGIDPAENVARVAREQRGVPTLAEFFGSGLAQHLVQAGKAADVIHANNVLAHVADLNDVVEGFRIMLKPDGVAVIEVPYVRDMVDRCEFDTIYHEHLCYFSLTALDRLFDRHGLSIVDVERIALHGGSLRVTAGTTDGPATLRRSSAVAQLLAEERVEGLDQAGYYARFSDRVLELKTALVGLLASLRADGKRIAAYGAAAKGSTLLNSFGIGRELIDFVVDRSTYKQGRYMPGVRLPIFGPDRLLEEMPDYTLLLTWNFADEILAQQAHYRRLGGRFIIPVPEPRVVGHD